MSVRRAAEGDGPAISTIVQRAFSHYVPRIGRRPGPMDLDYAALVGRGEAFVRGEPIEAALVARPQDDHLFVSVIAVEPGRQGRGAGRELMAFAEAEAARRGLTELRLHTHVRMTENVGFYTHLGYEIHEQCSENGFQRVYLRKRLRSRPR